jgi:hypothetical protein
LGLPKDGHLKAAMLHPSQTQNRGQCNVSHWELKMPAAAYIDIAQ